MRIALDYDGTYTADPVFFQQLIELAKSHGHAIVCVTMRYEHEPVDIGIPVIYTARKAKAVAVQDIDVWIDDSPNWLLNDSF